jgi:hypothetical protein
VEPQGKLLLTVQFLSSMVQALLMIPVAIWLYRIGGWRWRGLGRSWMILGVVALGGVELLRLVALVDAAVSDIIPCQLREDARGSRRGVQSGELALDANIKELASYFGTVFRGIAVQARDGKSRQHLVDLGKIAIRCGPEAASKQVPSK